MIKKVSILSTLFIFGVIAPGWADEVKLIQNMTNQEIRIKVDENKIPMRKKKGPAKTATRLSEKHQNRSPTDIPYMDYGSRVRRATLKIDFLKAVEEKKRIPLAEGLDRIISSYDFVQQACEDKLFHLRGRAEAHLSKPESSQPILGSPSPGNKYFDGGRVLDKFKPVKPKKEESFKAIFMEFHLTYHPVNQNVFIKMNLTPSENKPGLMISF